MFCDNCGASVVPGQNFCNKCGKQLVPEVNPSVQEPAVVWSSLPPRPVQSRIQKHTKILAILWIAFSTLGVARGFAIFIGGSMALHFIPFPMRAMFLPIAGAIGAFLLAGSVAGLVAGWGLLKYRPWARVLALILGVISLVDLFLGTALGIYTLWVLLPAESEREYQRLARMAY